MLNPGERRAQQHVAFEDDLLSETPEQAALRTKRNLGEWTRARAAAVKANDPEAIKILDEEYAKGIGVDFPGKAVSGEVSLDDLGFEADELGFEPDAPAPIAPPVRASQADVRKSDARAPALSKQDADETAFNVALKMWQRTPTGQYFVGQPDIRERFSKATGRPDPLANRDAAEIEHARETGDVSYGTSTTYNVAKPLASMAGFAVGGPTGASGAEFLVRSVALVNNLDKAVKAGAITYERAQDIALEELSKGAVTDAAWNFGLPLVGALAQKVPGVKWMQTGIEKAVERAMTRMGRTPSAPKPSLRDAKVDARVAETADPARQQAVRDLSARVSDDFVPTPGQVSGKPSLGETAANKAFPAAFEEQEAALRTAADGMLRETTTPAVGQPSAQALGMEIQRVADATQEKVKQRLRPAFQAADQLGVKVDMTDVRRAVAKALLADSKVPGGTLAPAERAQLETIFNDLRLNPNVGAEQALDFISRRKEQLRATTADWKPSKAYDKVIGDLTTAADTAYVRAAGNAGKGDVVRDLLAAQRDYKQMMGTIYDDAIKAALKKNPEDIGRFLWQGGNVSEPQQFQRMLSIAQREGAMSRTQAEDLSKAMTRGFMQEAIPDIKAAARWSEMLKENPARRRTWNELTSAAGGHELRETMKVLEQAAQMATGRDSTQVQRLPFGIVLGRAAQGGLGLSLVTGAFHPLMALGGLTIAGLTKAMSTAYTRGDKGTLNTIAKVIRLRDASTPAATQALRAALDDLEAAAVKYGIDLIGEQQETQ